MFVMTTQTTGLQISFSRNGERESVCQVHVDHDVGIVYGIQGENFFQAVLENIDKISKLVNMMLGHVLFHHIEIYKKLGFHVDVDHECIIDGHRTAFVIIRRK